MHLTPQRSGSCTRWSAVLLLAVLSLLAFAPTAAAADAGALGVQGTLKTKSGPIEGATVTVSLDGAVVGETVSGTDGKWSISLSEPGDYEVSLDVASLPEGVVLRETAKNPAAVSVVDRTMGTIFGLVDEDAAAGGAAGVHSDSMLDRIIDRIGSGLRVGTLVALASIGLSLVFGVTGLVNFAHSELVTFGALAAFAIEEWTGWPLVFVICMAALLGAGVGYLLERGLFAPLRQRRLSNISLMVVSIGMAYALRNLYLVYFGGEPQFFNQYRIQKVYDLGPFSMPPKDYFIIGVALVVLLGVGLVLQKTKLGTSMRAVADNRDLAESSGIDVRRTVLAVWMTGAGLAALGGTFLGLTQRISYQMGERQLLLIFAAVTLGGLGTAYGAILGGLSIGMASELSTLWLDNDLKFLVALAVLIVILLLRPQGILGKRERFG